MNIQDIIQQVVQSTDIPLLTALLLGILVAINPCQLAINISALSYLYKDTARQGFASGIAYIVGRIITYTLLGWLLIYIIGIGKSTTIISQILSQGETILPYLLTSIGIFLIVRTLISHKHHDDNCHNVCTVIKRRGTMGPLILGILLAFAFCPESAIFYFGIMLPMAVETSTVTSLLIPLCFAVASVIPVAIIAFLISKATERARRFQHFFDNAQQWLNAITGILFIVIAILLWCSE